MVEFKHRIVTQASRTTTGTQDFTVTGFGTPTAWIVTISHQGDGAVIGIGFAYKPSSSVIQHWVGAAATDNDTTAIWAIDTDAAFEAQALNYLGPTITDELLEATGDLITDGIQLTYTTAPAAALTVRVDLIQCDEAFVGTQSFGASASATGVGFQPNVLFMASAVASQAGYAFRLGLACEGTGGITQGSTALNSGGNNAPTNVHQVVRTDRFACLLAGAGATINSWELDSFDADGFSYSRDQGVTPASFAFLALQVADLDLWVGDATTATSVGAATYTEPGFTAGGGWLYTTFVQTADASQTSGSNGTLGFGSVSHQEQAGCTTSVQDGANPTNTSSRSSTTSALIANADDGSLAIEGVVAPASGGFQVTYSAVDATPRYFLALVYEAGDLFESIDETLGLSEEVQALAGWAIDETLGITEEVVYFVQHAILEEPVRTGEGGFAAAVVGEGGQARVEVGEGGSNG